MKQVFQNMSNGETFLMEVPAPFAGDGRILIKTRTSLISSGTERSLAEFGKSNWLDRARKNPDKVRMVLEKVKNEGPITAVQAVTDKLNEPLKMGYCNVGVVVSSNVKEFPVGARVVSNGYHAEYVCVPKNLCCLIPAGVSDDEAVFTVPASVALQGIRLLAPTLGETFVVTGLGLIGLLAVQLLVANGCRVLGIDYSTSRCAQARKFGAETCDMSEGEDPLAKAEVFSRFRGVDGVLITASTNSNEVINQSAKMCRKRGRIVLVGVVGTEFSRADFYEKEVSFQVSCSYGPGRYDTEYEEKGADYPIGFVRWTEQRNFEAVLDLLAAGQAITNELITHRHDVKDAVQAYEKLSDKNALGIVLEYADVTEYTSSEHRVDYSDSLPAHRAQNEVVVGVIGSGNYASRVLIPAFNKSDALIHAISSIGGASAGNLAEKYNLDYVTSNSRTILDDTAINTVVIATRHDTHCDLVCESLQAGKNVFVEKPLALTLDEITKIDRTYKELSEPPMLMVGFNRRFAPQIKFLKGVLSKYELPSSFVYTINAGAIPTSHWTQDVQIGGGRIIGECCHFIDLLRYLSGSKIVRHHILGINVGSSSIPDTVTIALEFQNGSVGSINYFANGHSSYPKERLEAFVGGQIFSIDNFKTMKAFGPGSTNAPSFWGQRKGQNECVAEFVAAIQNGESAPISYDELIEVSRATIELSESLVGKIVP